MDVTEITEDGFLDGRVRVRQLAHGFRSGLDAVMLAAAVPARPGDTVLELGSGAGVASLCLAARVAGCAISGAEIDSTLVGLANENVAANEVTDRVRFVQGDVLKLPADLRAAFDHVFCNPPFHDPEGENSPDALRARALQDVGDLPRWLEIGIRRTTSHGTLTVILRADRLNAALNVLPGHGVNVFPLWPKAGAPAKRVLIQVCRDKRAPLVLLPGLILHERGGRYTKEANAILRDGAAIFFNPSERQQR